MQEELVALQRKIDEFENDKATAQKHIASMQGHIANCQREIEQATQHIKRCNRTLKELQAQGYQIMTANTQAHASRSSSSMNANETARSPQQMSVSSLGDVQRTPILYPSQLVSPQTISQGQANQFPRSTKEPLDKSMKLTRMNYDRDESVSEPFTTLVFVKNYAFRNLLLSKHYETFSARASHLRSTKTRVARAEQANIVRPYMNHNADSENALLRCDKRMSLSPQPPQPNSGTSQAEDKDLEYPDDGRHGETDKCQPVSNKVIIQHPGTIPQPVLGESEIFNEPSLTPGARRGTVETYSTDATPFTAFIQGRSKLPDINRSSAASRGLMQHARSVSRHNAAAQLANASHDNMLVSNSEVNNESTIKGLGKRSLLTKRRKSASVESVDEQSRHKKSRDYHVHRDEDNGNSSDECDNHEVTTPPLNTTRFLSRTRHDSPQDDFDALSSKSTKKTSEGPSRTHFNGTNSNSNSDSRSHSPARSEHEDTAAITAEGQRSAKIKKSQSSHARPRPDTYQTPTFGKLPAHKRNHIELIFCAYLAKVMGHKLCIKDSPNLKEGDVPMMAKVFARLGAPWPEYPLKIPPDQHYHNALDFQNDTSALLQAYISLGPCASSTCPFPPPSNRTMCWRMRLQSFVDGKMRELARFLRECEERYAIEDDEGREGYMRSLAEGWKREEEADLGSCEHPRNWRGGGVCLGEAVRGG